jgi:hypothetical protein
MQPASGCSLLASGCRITLPSIPSHKRRGYKGRVTAPAVQRLAQKPTPHLFLSFLGLSKIGDMFKISQVFMDNKSV